MIKDDKVKVKIPLISTSLGLPMHRGGFGQDTPPQPRVTCAKMPPFSCLYFE